MKKIETLIEDIYALIQSKEAWFDDTKAADFSSSVVRRLQSHYNTEQTTARLRLSQMGPRCPKALWHSIHTPESAEPLPPWAKIKYSYGHIIEAQTIALAKAAGHTVEGEQDELKLDGIVGHRDCVIDGCVVDVKSASSRGFSKFKDKSILQNDDFGYLDQLDGYVVASRDDPCVRVRDKGYILAIDKTLGHMVIYEHRIREEQIRRRIKEFKAFVNNLTAPACNCRSIPVGSSGNLGLDTKASYSAYKFCCFPNLRTFLYANGPKYLTHVERKPDVPEVDKHGKIVHH